jgi:ribosomal protein L2
LTSAPIIFVYQSSNPNHGARKLRKAGQSRWLGRRPIVRGVAMNPVDNPNGGRTPGGKVYRCFSTRVLKHKQTKNKKYVYNAYIIYE